MNAVDRDPLRMLQQQAVAANQRSARLAREIHPADQAGPLFEAMPLPAVLLSRAGRLLRANAQARQRLQLDEDPAVPALADGLLNCLGLDDRRRLLEALRLAQPGQLRQLDPLRLCGGSQQDALVTAWLQAVPELAGGTAVLLQWQEAGSERLSALQQGLLDQSPDAWQAFDPQGRQIYANPTARHWLGQGDSPDRSGAAGMALDRLLPLGAGLPLQQKLLEVLRTGRAQAFEHPLHTSGGTRQIRVSNFPLHGPQGELIGVGSCWQDVTAQWQQGQDQQLSEAFFLYAHDAMVVADAAGLVRRVNPAFERQSGFSAANMAGRSLRLLHDPAEDEPSYDAIWALVQRDGHWSGQVRRRNADGSHSVGWGVCNAIRPELGRTGGYLVSFTDLTALHRAHEEVARLASFDSLTGLPNRSLFQDRLRQQELLAVRQAQPFALLFIDLDHFKEVNDTQGHHVGDELLVLIAHRLRDSVREMDTVARLGGDEFVVLLPGTGRAAAQELAQRLMQHLHAPLQLDALPGYRPQASVGLAMYPEDGADLATLMRYADQAMYAAKRAGRHQLQVFRPELERQHQHSFDLQLELRQALAEGQLRLHLQPKFRLDDLAVVGAEALLRWQHPRRGLLAPGSFLSAAGQHQLLEAIDAWVLQAALSQLAQWRAAGRWPQGWKLALNLMPSDLATPVWLEQLEALLAQLALPAACLEFELSEAAWAQAVPEVLQAMRRLRQLGVGLAIDDFGTGYSSLSYLKRLPASVVKIDQGFVRGLQEQAQDRILVEAVVMLAQGFQLEAVAEGVETEAQRRQLLQLGCQLGQGYLLSPPLAVEDFAARFLQPA